MTLALEVPGSAGLCWRMNGLGLKPLGRPALPPLNLGLKPPGAMRAAAGLLGRLAVLLLPMLLAHSSAQSCASSVDRSGVDLLTSRAYMLLSTPNLSSSPRPRMMYKHIWSSLMTRPAATLASLSLNARAVNSAIGSLGRSLNLSISSCSSSLRMQLSFLLAASKCSQSALALAHFLAASW